MSESTVTQLKLLSAPRLNSGWSAAAATGASVKTKASIVAMSGAIIPAPLAMPLIATSTPPRIAVRSRASGTCPSS